VEPYLYWILTAIALVVVELLSGTFYLLILAIAASAAAVLAWLGVSFPVQAIAATALAILGVVLVHRYHARTRTSPSGANDIDVGQRVTLESWINEAEGLARVIYRGTLWDAKVIGERAAGTSYYIRGADGSTLHISAAPASRAPA
jgi:membrane protein implicated in regulation of membrane protease activity